MESMSDKLSINSEFSSVQLLSHVRLFVTPWTAARQASLSITQTHVHWVGDVIQPSYPLSFPSPPTLSLSQHGSFPLSQLNGSFPLSLLFTSGGQSIGVSASASVLPMNIQSSFPLGWTGSISPQSKVLSRIFSRTTIQITQVNSLNSYNSNLQKRKPRHGRTEVASHS